MPEQQIVRSVRTGAPDTVAVPTAAEAEVAALIRERDGYLRRGLDERAALVDEQLRLRGHVDPGEPVKKPRPRGGREKSNG